ncbi:rhodanese-like domain-containing protein [Ruminococcaceae bacterium OttesenSCG-928-O06]|nr:rhodanese-like domain-containing protein [Ruminococcaceae bacterium OttesenSCG-928-O06]
MKNISRVLLLALSAVLLLGTLTACDPSDYAASDQIIIDAKDLSGYVGKEDVVIIDMQDEEGYAAGHVPGAVNIQVSSVLVNLPVDNMLASPAKVANVLGAAGISNSTQVVIYDEGRSLNASRMWWTMLVYGHDNVKVVSGGVPAIQAAGVELTAERPSITPATFEVTDRREEYVADMRTVQNQVDDPQENVILLDVRSFEEYETEGKIPGSILYPHTKNFYSDGTLIDTQATRINYIEQGVRAENEIITYCRTSMRSAVTFLRLYDAGYRNIKMYDGAWLEWSSNPNNPIDIPEGGSVPHSSQDNS